MRPQRIGRTAMEYLHTMIEVRDLQQSLDFYCGTLGMIETRRMEYEEDRCTIVFLCAPGDLETAQFDARFAPNLELYAYWDDEERFEKSQTPWGHLGYRVDNIYETCRQLMDAGITVIRPPRDGFRAYVKTPEGVTVEFIQRRPALTPAEPWISMPDNGTIND
ncbi:VOC family protein [Neorhizobium petrolearium]|uniref:VOC family protein n=1 Tax=Neorhizobium petrolearium TaxID=515361 RepID=UPI003F5CE98D